MKSKTSFFNLTLLRKNVLRFSPIWITDLVIWTLAMPVLLSMQLFDREELLRPDWGDVAQSIGQMLQYIGPAYACLYSLLVTMALFSYLYTARSVSLFHALPIRRGGLFLTNYVSGLLFLFVPNLLVMLMTLAVTAAGGVFVPGMIFSWMIGMCAMELFFFSFAVFIAMFTGHILALPVFYGIFNALAIVLYLSVCSFITPLLYGMDMNFPGDSVAMWLTPLGRIYQDLTLDMEYTSAYSSMISNVTVTGWATLAAYAVAGVILAVLACFIYTRRRSESAGDVVSVGWAKVLFRYGVALTAGLTIGQALYYLLFEASVLSGTAMELICMIAVACIGFWIAQMLLNKSFHVLKKSLRGSAICATVLLVIFTSAKLDVFGFVNRVPAADQVDSVRVTISGTSMNFSSAVLSEPESIEKVLEVHRYALENRDTQDTAYDDGYAWVELDYHLKNGTDLMREYDPLKMNWSDASNPFYTLVNTKEYRAAWTLDTLYTQRDEVTIKSASLSFYNPGDPDTEQERVLSAKDTQTVYAALLEDADAGRMPSVIISSDDGKDLSAQEYVNTLSFNYVCEYPCDSRCTLAVSPSMTATIAALQACGILNDTVKLMTYDELYGYHSGSGAQKENSTKEIITLPATEAAEGSGYVVG